jgi:hypothetical protein
MRKLMAIALMTIMLAFVACSTHTHIVGKGAQGSQKVENRQWYILFGLVPLNDVSTNEMAAGATDYTIQTQQCALDVIMNIFTMYVTVSSRTVTVTK